jgi:uncharacterized protein (TIGR03083 family)
VVPDGFVRALDGFEAMVAGVPPGCWDAPSPCEGWCAADVAGHVIGALRATEAFATGRPEAGSAALLRVVMMSPRPAGDRGQDQRPDDDCGATIAYIPGPDRVCSQLAIAPIFVLRPRA